MYYYFCVMPMYAIIHYAKKTKSIFPKSNMVLTSLILEVVAMILK